MFRLLFLTLALSSPVYADNFADLSGAGTNDKLDRATFTNTQTWNKRFLGMARERTRFLPSNWKSTFALPEPPANSSPRTQAELAALAQLASERPKKLSEIRKEVEVTNFQFGNHRYDKLTTGTGFSETGKALTAAYSEMATVVFTFKERFNRVRPSVLDSTLTTAIEIPQHPAYPSGHATAVFMIAYLLQELDPPNAERYLKDAARISRNREIAGVHYASDSAAGRVLGRQIADALLSNSSFHSQIQKAKSEWP